jgi:hypothetical protein
MTGAYFKGCNFWETFSDFRAISEFEQLYKEDKSAKKNRSSNIMWAIAFCLRRESPMYNLPNKWELSARDIIGEKDFDWETVEIVVNVFKQTQLTQAERSLIAWEELMFKRDKYLKGQEYYFDQYLVDKSGDNVVTKTGQFVTVKGTAEQLDKAFSTTPKMYSDFSKIRKEIEDEDIKRGRGNKVISASDSNEI